MFFNVLFYVRRADIQSSLALHCAHAPRRKAKMSGTTTAQVSATESLTVKVVRQMQEQAGSRHI